MALNMKVMAFRYVLPGHLVVKSPFDVPLLKVFPDEMYNFRDLKSIVSVLNICDLRVFSD
jgi:hypothetical protein